MAAIERQDLAKFGNLELLAKQVVEGFITGLHKSPFHGFSVEFAEHRIYNPGESTRHIDWKLYGRTEKLFTKRYEEETNLRCQIVIDHSSSMLFPQKDELKDVELNKLDFSVYAAASMIQLLKKQRDAVGLSIFNESIEFHIAAKSSIAHHRFLYHQLEQLLNDEDHLQQKKTSAVDALHQIAESIPKRSMVVIFSDMFDNSEKEDDLFDALQHLRHNKHEVALFHVLDKQHELKFEYGNQPHTFIDLESGEKVKLTPSQVKKSFEEQAIARQNELKLKCGQYKIDYNLADINQGFNHILSEFMIKRSKMK